MAWYVQWNIQQTPNESMTHVSTAEKPGKKRNKQIRVTITILAIKKKKKLDGDHKQKRSIDYGHED
jgi:hypothetical protein